jgi:hypothetical protein
VDFSSILIVPFSALVALATLVGAAIAKRPEPRLIWPCAFSTFMGGLVFLRLPDVSALGLWLMALFGLAFAAAIGTIVGGASARLGKAAIRTLRHR